MPPQDIRSLIQTRRQALRKAKRITGMLQGTMGLEGQGLDKRTLWGMTKQTARELLAARS
jgi:hypothetical protein